MSEPEDALLRYEHARSEAAQSSSALEEVLPSAAWFANPMGDDDRDALLERGRVHAKCCHDLADALSELLEAVADWKR